MRRRKTTDKAVKAVWLITFSDLVTLLLALFVLVLSMSSLDSAFLERIGEGLTQADEKMTGKGRVEDRIRMAAQLLRRPEQISRQEMDIKDLLFPTDVLPPGIDRVTVAGNVRIQPRSEGAAIILDEALLFEPASERIPESGRQILAQLVPLLRYMRFDITVSGYADAIEDVRTGVGTDLYELSNQRALAVLGFFLGQGLETGRFSAAGYGPDRPLKVEAGEKDHNRRVEILIKTAKPAGSYS